MTSEGPTRHYQSFLGAAEHKLIRAIVADLPASVTPLQLTRIGMFGAIVAAVALVGCRWSPLWLPLLPVGIFLNWFGIALDGPLAQHRRIEHPRLGFVDHAYDFLSQILIIIAFGASPFLSLGSALIVLACYLLFSAYTYIRAIARHVQQMSYIGLGATEFRILMVAWAFIAQAAGINETGDGGVSTLDVAIMFLAVLAVVGLAIKAVSDARRMAADEGR